MSKYRVIDLCSGMGGLSYSAKKAGLSILAGIDASKDAIETYKRNFRKKAAICGDVSCKDILYQHVPSLKSKKSGNPDLIIVSGPPCQGFSVAGTRRAEDPRNGVLLNVATLVACLRPTAALIENVPSMQKDIYSAHIRRFRSTLNKAGYHVNSIELNAIDFGLPQNRLRIIYFITPFRVKKQKILEYIKRYYRTAPTVRDLIGDLPRPPLRPLNYDPYKNNGTLPNHYAMRHSEKVRKKIAAIEPGSGPLSYRKLDPDSHAATLLSGHRAPPVHYRQRRSITVREALRLQGFPDSFRVMGTFSNQMGQVTNAVPVPMGKAAIKVLLKLLGEKNESR